MTPEIEAELAALAERPDSELDFSDIPEETDFSGYSRGTHRPPKEPVSIRLDADVLAWFRRGEGSYQTRINAVLRQYMLAHE